MIYFVLVIRIKIIKADIMVKKAMRPTDDSIPKLSATIPVRNDRIVVLAIKPNFSSAN